MKVTVRKVLVSPWKDGARLWRWRMLTDSGGYFEGWCATQPEALSAGCAVLHVWSRPS